MLAVLFALSKEEVRGEWKKLQSEVLFTFHCSANIQADHIKRTMCDICSVIEKYIQNVGKLHTTGAREV